MVAEIEAKAIKIDKDQIREKLKKLGATLIFKEKMFKRITFELPVPIENNDSISTWIRLRTDGNETTLTLKSAGEKIDSVHEIEISVDDFEESKELLLTTGFKQKNQEENYRERWTIEDVEFDIDTWPMVDPWLEIEAPNEKLIKKYFKLLNLDYSKAYFGSADIVYDKEYGIKILNMKRLGFSDE